MIEMTDPRTKTEIAADYEAEISRLKHPATAQHIINHPIGKAGVEYDIVTVLLDLAAQENCDGEPYDQMQQAGLYIRELRTQLAERDATISELESQINASAIFHDGHEAQMTERDAEIERLREWQAEAVAHFTKMQTVIRDYLPPDSGVSERDAMNSIIYLLDGPEERKLLEQVK